MENSVSRLSSVSRKGYQSQCFVPEVHHRVAPNQRVHKADHVMSALGELLGRHLIGDDVQALVHLKHTRTNKRSAKDNGAYFAFCVYLDCFTYVAAGLWIAGQAKR